MRFTLTFVSLALGACTATHGEGDASRSADSAAQRDSTQTASSNAPGDSISTAPSRRTLTAEGWGPLRIGMTRTEVVGAAGPDASPAVGAPISETCDQFRPQSAPQGLLVMLERDTLTRISLSRNVKVATDAGFAVGDSASAVERHYGTRAAVTPHKYQEAPARYITTWTRGRPPASSARGIVYEIGGDGRIMQIHAGGPSIQYVEGCL